ncbi:solute carrier family 13 member 2 isoform X2 [Amphiprion ocellaris]|nr:solute carrier family 13 member 2 isoform X2 [Amphiprion ocellaris]
MALYWCTECIPLAVTALLPVVLFPMMGIMEGTEVVLNLYLIVIDYYVLNFFKLLLFSLFFCRINKSASSRIFFALQHDFILIIFSSLVQVCIQYLKDSNMLFFGGLVVAIAVEHWNLHQRIALQVLLVVGVKPSLLMMGFMSTTAFLSMWISNTAATAMMLPISSAVLQQLSDTEANAEEREYRLTAAMAGQDNQTFELDDTKQTNNKELKPEDSSISMDKDQDGNFKGMKELTENGVTSNVCDMSPDSEQRRLKREQKYAKLLKGMSLSVCYSATIGGTATLTGCTPNVIMKGQLDELFPENGGIINFATWFGFAFPTVVLMLALSWLWIQFMFLGFNLKKSCGCGTNKDGDREAYRVIKDQYKKLGGMTFAEVCVLVIFTLVVLMWFTREPGFIPGWATVLFNKDKPYVTDGTVAILMSSLFFCIPSNLPRCFGKSKDGSPPEAPTPMLNWGVVNERMPWNIILLLGGGFALAHGSEKSGLSKWLGECLLPLQSVPPFAICILLCLLVAMFTECSSNTATTTLFLPIVASMATAIKIHPMYVMLPCTLAASLAFMLPVATPPNAIAFSYADLKVMDMAKTGFMLNLIGIIAINIAINTWGVAMFQLNTFPSWANVTKSH